MDVSENNLVSPTREAPGSEANDLPTEQLLGCCERTINMHAANNPMMVCAECKQIIKCFNDERAFKNYQKFCASRHRKIFTTAYREMLVVVYRAYQTYSS